MFVSVIVVAAGKGSRMKRDMPKQFMLLGDKPVLAHSLEVFQEHKDVAEIIISVPEAYMEFCRKEIVEKYNFQKVKEIVSGEDQRQGSVYNALEKIKSPGIVLVHDGVRPFVSEKNITDVIRTVEAGNSCVLGVRVKDTIKVCDGDGVILNTPSRENLWAVQTPQGFDLELLLKAHRQARAEGFNGTDDGILVERLAGEGVKVIEGSYENIKITTEEDLAYAEFAIQRYKKKRGRHIE